MTSEPSDRDRQRDLAWAEAFAGLSRVAATLSVRLRAVHEPGAPAAAEQPAVRAGDGQVRPRLPRGGFGFRQQAVLALGGLDGELGLAAADVANAIGLTSPNAHKLLAGLEGLGALERVPDERPLRWRRGRP